MSPIPTASILEHFAELNDPRVERTKEHQLLDIIAIALCAVICGAEGWTQV
ncbi:MAG TPA: transposase family protein, partial [Ardenticatenaceae bacterium]